jgi:hypothetical protein
MKTMKAALLAVSLLGFLSMSLYAALPAAAQENDATKLAKAVQNPVADLISLPFQYNANFGVGPEDDTQHVLNIQPVYPVNLNADWNLITRTIVPVISQPPFAAGQERENGVGDIQLSLFLSPVKPWNGVIWGAGVIGQFPTASDDRLGQGKYGLGPTAVALKITGPWVVGGLINNIWSVGGDAGRDSVNQMLFQPFVNYNFPDHAGRYLTFSPIITANWKADSGNRWTLPVGLGVGQIMKVGGMPVNLQASAYYNVEKPDVVGADWQLRLQMALLFPK